VIDERWQQTSCGQETALKNRGGSPEASRRTAEGLGKLKALGTAAALSVAGLP